jgi:type IV secretory pathway VirB10-like protein
MSAGVEKARRQLAAWQIVALLGLASAGAGGAGFLAWKRFSGEAKAAPVRPTADESRLLAKAEEQRARADNDARKLHQADVGSGYQVDIEANLTGPADSRDLPSNKSLDDVSGGGADRARAAISDEIRGRAIYADRDGQGAKNGDGNDEKVQRAELEKSMLGYSTVKAAKWAMRRPDLGDDAEAGGAGKGVAKEGSSDLLAATEKRLAGLRDGMSPVPRSPSSTGAGSPGPSGAGGELMPAETQAQPFGAGSVGDMRIGTGAGPEQIVRQGKFLDCVLVNEIRADLLESPAIGMVSRDFVSLDGQYVLIPAGAKLIGSAGRVQNLQQARVYLRFDRVIFPDQRSAFFPVRKLPAVDGPGAVGIEGDVDRHFMLMFGSAVMLGLLDGLAAAVEGANSAATPTARDLIMARTSMNLSQVVAGILARYGNVVPTITVKAGARMKVFFAEDVRMTPYMLTRDLSWVKAGRR